MFVGPITVTTLTMNVNSIAFKEKALLEVFVSLSPDGKQIPAHCKTDSGAETNIIPKSLYQQLSPGTPDLQQPTMKLTAYGGTEIHKGTWVLPCVHQGS